MSTMVETPTYTETQTLVTGLSYATVIVKSQELARRFYAEALGFEIDRDELLPDGQRFLTVRAPGAQTGIVLMTDPHAHEDEAEMGGCCGSGGCGSCGTSYAWTGMMLGTQDIDAAYRQLGSRGVTFLQPPQERPYGKEALLADPDGNVFSLVQR